MTLTAGAKECFICDAHKSAGITILSAFICFECEREIVAASRDDLKYPLFLSRVKKLWSRLGSEEPPEARGVVRELK